MATTTPTTPTPAPADDTPTPGALTPKGSWSIVQALCLAIDCRLDAVEGRITPSSGLAEHLRTIGEALVAITNHICNTHLYGEDAGEE